MKVLVSGGNGLLARNILPVLGRYFEVFAHDIDEWDITVSSSNQEFLELYRPDAVINCAAMTDVDGCEDKKELAYKVNAEGPGTLAASCARFRIHLVHVSTDYVFDGAGETPYREEDEPNPMSVYGLSKLAGERRIFNELPHAVVLRTQWLYGAGGTSFVSKIVKLARDNGSVRVVSDQIGSPTYARDLGEPIAAMIQKKLTGIYHVSNSGSCTWFDFAQVIFALLRMDIPVSPIASAELGRKAPRPPYSVFDLSKLEHVTGICMRSWQDALREYLESGNEDHA
ncbi:MAG: dTDP-4-dehydrorhamnose reductase [Syntrophorhabdaceae bacterium]